MAYVCEYGGFPVVWPLWWASPPPKCGWNVNLPLAKRSPLSHNHFCLAVGEVTQEGHTLYLCLAIVGFYTRLVVETLASCASVIKSLLCELTQEGGPNPEALLCELTQEGGPNPEALLCELTQEGGPNPEALLCELTQEGGPNPDALLCEITQEGGPNPGHGYLSLFPILLYLPLCSTSSIISWKGEILKKALVKVHSWRKSICLNDCVLQLWEDNR